MRAGKRFFPTAETCPVYMIGEQPEELPDWYICENEAMEERTEGSPLENQDSDSAGTGYPAGYFLAVAVFVLAAGTASGVVLVRQRKKKR